MMLLLDTHVLVWLMFEEHNLGIQARRALDNAWSAGEAAVSAMTFWELALLREKNRLDYIGDVAAFRAELMEEQLIEIPIDGEIGILANRLPRFHADPADRIIVATTFLGHQLMTSDERILRWEGNLRRLDARE